MQAWRQRTEMASVAATPLEGDHRVVQPHKTKEHKQHKRHKRTFAVSDTRSYMSSWTGISAYIGESACLRDRFSWSSSSKRGGTHLPVPSELVPAGGCGSLSCLRSGDDGDGGPFSLYTELDVL
jgi:hypothetical protein